MNRLLSTLVAAALLAAAPAFAQDEPSLIGGGDAVPNFLGTTGLLLAPSAYTVGDRGISGHAYFTDNFNSYGIQAGIDRLEVGGTLLDSDGGSDELIFNAKFQLLRENIALPAISVGVVDAFDALDVDPSFYVAASKDLSRTIPLRLFPIRAHVGWGTGVYDEEPFFGLEMNIGTPLDILPITRPVISAMAEYVNDNFNLGLRGRYRGFAATLALFDFDDFGGGVSYTTGLRLR